MAVRKISTKLAVEGEAEYKRAITNCNSELGRLKSALAATQSEYRNNANSLAALEAKSNDLKAIQAEQTNKIKLLTEALKNCRDNVDTYSAQQKELKDRLEKSDAAVAALSNSSKKAGEEWATHAQKIEDNEKALERLKSATGDTSAAQAKLEAEIKAEREAMAKLEESTGGAAKQAGELVLENRKLSAANEENTAKLDAATRGANNWEKQLNSARIEADKTSDEIAKNNQYLNEAKNSADGCATSIDKFGKETKKAGDDSKDAINQLAAALAAAGIAKTVKEIADVLMECSAAAASFETSLAKVSTLADTTAVPMETLKGELISLSSETGVAVGALAEATYQALSAGVETANVVDFVATATKLSAAGFTESATAVDALTTVLNAYGMAGSETEKIASMLVKTQDLGKTSVDELAASMGRVIPTAAAYGVGVDQITSAYAVLTKRLSNTKITTTDLSAMLDELASNSSNVASILEDKTGKSFSDLMADGSTLADVIQIISESVDGNSTAFKNLWSSTTASTAAMILFHAGSEEFNETLTAMQTSSGALDRNFKIMADTTEFAQQRMTTATENLKIAIGDQLNPALEKLYTLGGDAFTWATDFVKENPWIVNAVVGLTAAIAALVLGVGALAAAPAIIGAVNAALALLAANPVVAVTAAVVGLGVAIASWIATSKEADEETKAFKETLEETKAAYEELSSTMEEQQEATTATADALKELLEVENKSETQKAAIADMVDRLNESVPELGLAYDAASDSINMTTESLDALLDRSSRQAEYEAQVGRLSELYTEQAEINARLTEAQNALADAQATGSGNTRTLQNNIDELTAALEENQAQIATLEEESREWGEWQAASDTATQKMTSTVSGLISEMEALEKEYAEAYQAAYDNINGQIGLFQEMDGSAKKSIDDLIGALQSQVDYMSTYAENIQKAMELGVDEGLVKKLSDGSEESAQILAAIVEGGEDQIAALNEEFAKVEEGKENFSTTIAEMETDFSARMSDIERRIQRTVDELDVSIEAGEAGAATIQGYIDGAEGMRSSLVAKYRSLANAANNAYKSTLDINSPSRVFAEHGKNTMRGAIEGAESEKDDLERAYKELAEAAVEAYERGQPRGSEGEVLAAQKEQTAALAAAVASSGGGGPTYQFHIGEMNVRDDQDVERVAEELYRLTAQATRSKGGGTL